MGANTTNVVVHEDGVPSFVRIIPSGGADVTNSIVQRLQFSPEQAEGAKRALGMGTQLMRQEDRPVIEIIYEVVGELLTSIRSTLSYYANQRPSEPVSRIVLTGGGAHLNGLPKAFADLTSMPVVVADAFAQVTSKSKEQYTPEQRDGYAVALGLALGSRA
jgi:type IV pilus assembly protein PilM